MINNSLGGCVAGFFIGGLSSVREAADTFKRENQSTRYQTPVGNETKN